MMKFRKAFKGNWGAEAHTKRAGIVQDLNRLSRNSALSQLRKTNLDKKLKIKEESSSKIRSTSSNESLSKIDKRNIEVVDVCTLIKRCTIDEISKYLLKQSKKKGFPDISKR